MPYSKF